MSNVLDAVLDNVQIPHQPWVVITDSSTFSGVPLFRELLRRSLARRESTLLIAVVHPPKTLLPRAVRVDEANLKIINLTETVKGYSTEESWQNLHERVLSSLAASGSHVQLFIDALDVLAEDYTPARTIQLIRSLLRTILTLKAPSRLVVVLPHTSSFHPQLLTPTLSSALTLLSPHHPRLLTHLSRIYMKAIEPSPSPAFWQILERSRERRTGENLAWSADEGVEISIDWFEPRGAIVQILIRKSTGGSKGITRILAALTRAVVGLKTVSLSELVSTDPISGPGALSRTMGNEMEIDVPFNLALTEEQRRRRAEVPLPYAHEGEGVGAGAGAGLDWGDEEDDDDDEEI
ncbi:MAG: hypothetical protein TREMPRED_003075 [Tremellales sp. Tagirdzhanova-0007]|nr:MAG: hypothetical protein TREMPRED_003075 [Tremellales sp. Tagirdzhanova-0007]